MVRQVRQGLRRLVALPQQSEVHLLISLHSHCRRPTPVNDLDLPIDHWVTSLSLLCSACCRFVRRSPRTKLPGCGALRWANDTLQVGNSFPEIF